MSISANTLPKLLESICQGQDLSKEQSFMQFNNFINGEMSSIEMAALLTALKAKGETCDEIVGAVRALRHGARPFPEAEVLKRQHIIVDCAGTGGDGQHTLNISTAVAILLACCDVKVAKHGGRAVSSKCGAADILENVGVNIECPPEHAKKALEEVGTCFLYAPYYHLGARKVADVRQTLKIRTIFNLLGPLLNPLHPEYQLIGVYDPSLCRPFAKVLQQLGLKKALIVHGAGLDEIAIHGPTQGALLSDDKITDFTLTPEQVGLPSYPISTIWGDDVNQNSDAFIKLLSGTGTAPYRACVALNAGAILWMLERVDSIKDGVKRVQSLLNTDLGLTKLNHLIEVSHAK
jgi:anthranilate phosphoribosyltransferase